MQDSEDSKEKLDEIVKRATLNQFITVRDLAFIMAEEESYSDILPHLWKFYQCDIDPVFADRGRNGSWIPPWERGIIDLKLETPQERLAAWTRLLSRWAGIILDDEEGIYPQHFAEQAEEWRRENLKPVKYLNVYNHAEINDPTPKDLRFRLSSDWVKLDDLKAYIKNIEQTLQIKFPLPKRLFASVKDNTNEPASEDFEAFIRSLRVWFENDAEIKIQVPGKSAIPHRCEELGFRNEKTKTWTLLQDILKKTVHHHRIGPAYTFQGSIKQRIPSYDSRRKILDEINSKWIGFIKKTYGIEAPKGFKIYERLKSEGDGVYGFKFQIMNENTMDMKPQLSADELKKAIEDLSEKYKQNPQEGYVHDRLVDLGTLAVERGLLNQDQLGAMIQSHRPMGLETKRGGLKRDRYENENSEEDS